MDVRKKNNVGRNVKTMYHLARQSRRSSQLEMERREKWSSLVITKHRTIFTFISSLLLSSSSLWAFVNFAQSLVEASSIYAPPECTSTTANGRIDICSTMKEIGGTHNNKKIRTLVHWLYKHLPTLNAPMHPKSCNCVLR